MDSMMDFSGFYPDPPDISMHSEMHSEPSDSSMVDFSGFEEYLDLVSDPLDFIPPLASSATAHELDQLLPAVPSYIPDIEHDSSGVISSEELPTISSVIDDEEPSIDNLIPEPCYIAPEDESGMPTYIILFGTTQRGKNVLIDSRGYEYTLERITDSGLMAWRCVVRRKGFYCNAKFLPGRFTKDGQLKDPRGQSEPFTEHICQPKYKPEVVRKLRLDLKRKGLENIFEEAMTSVKTQLALNIPEEEYLLFTNLPSDVRLAAQVNYHRRLDRPEEVVELGFEIDLRNIPENFLQRDFCIRSATQVIVARHLICATPVQLYYLSKAVCWYIDATFSIVKDPFLQMFSVHVFVRYDNCIKQIPVAFVVMSRRSKEDYEQVFRELLKLLPQVHVKKIVLDFERAIWSTLRSMMSHNEFPKVTLKGCAFHYTQAVYRRIGILGLATQYKRDLGTKDICRQMMALALLPKEYVTLLFPALKERCFRSRLTNLKKFAIYMEKNWINGWFTPQDWVRFIEFVRTNNHTEGWHRALNKMFGKKNVNFYVLLKGLYQQAINAQRDAQQVFQGKLTTAMTPKDKKRNEFLDNLWGKLQRKEIEPASFLEKVSKKVQTQECQVNSRIDLDADDLEDTEYDGLM